jgi:hypothetical protein
VLRDSKVGNPFKMYIATQERVIGAVLLQEEDGKEFSVAYVSQSLLDAETRNVFVEKLCLSLYYACSKFSHYILSRHGRLWVIIRCKHEKNGFVKIIYVVVVICFFLLHTSYTRNRGSRVTPQNVTRWRTA